jgi:hypothetical protein
MLADEVDRVVGVDTHLGPHTLALIADPGGSAPAPTVAGATHAATRRRSGLPRRVTAANPASAQGRLQTPTVGYIDQMRTRASIVVCLVALTTVCATTLASAVSAGQSTPVATLHAEVHALQSGSARSYYALLSPSFRKHCPYSAFSPEDQERQLRGTTLRVLGQRVVGSKAYVTYEFLRGGSILAKASGDLYVKVGNKWFDEADKYTTC